MYVYNLRVLVVSTFIFLATAAVEGVELALLFVPFACTGVVAFLALLGVAALAGVFLGVAFLALLGVAALVGVFLGVAFLALFGVAVLVGVFLGVAFLALLGVAVLAGVFLGVS